MRVLIKEGPNGLRYDPTHRIISNAMSLYNIPAIGQVNREMFLFCTYYDMSFPLELNCKML